MRSSPALIAGVMFSLLLSNRAWASELPAAFVCEFTTGLFSAPEGARFVTSDAPDTMSMTYASIDQEGGTAQMIANMGAADVTLLVGRNVVHFLEATEAGNLTLTTIHSASHPEGRFFASHSRHIGSTKELLVSQYFGFCEAKWP
jgi:hypothetical protein